MPGGHLTSPGGSQCWHGSDASSFRSVWGGVASYALMLGIMVLSVVYDREFEPVITFAFDTGRGIIDTL